MVKVIFKKGNIIFLIYIGLNFNISLFQNQFKMISKITYFFLLGAFCLFLHSCVGISKAPIYTRPVQNNKDYTISYLFEHDGCKVYRFWDCGEPVYFTSCNGETSYKVDSTTVIRNRTKKE